MLKFIRTGAELLAAFAASWFAFVAIHHIITSYFVVVNPITGAILSDNSWPIAAGCAVVAFVASFYTYLLAKWLIEQLPMRIHKFCETRRRQQAKHTYLRLLPPPSSSHQ